MTSNVFLARLYRTPLVTVAAIKGACPAGGCCLSMCCDVRIMTVQVQLCYPVMHGGQRTHAVMVLFADAWPAVSGGGWGWVLSGHHRPLLCDVASALE